MNHSEIISIQKKIGAVADGFWGPRSISACQAHLRSLMPTPHPFPTQDQASLTRFYGEAGDESQLETIEFPIPMFYEGRPVKKTRVHRRLAPSLLDILSELGEIHGDDKRIMSHVQDFCGIYNNRPMRGGSLPSLHARGAAIDLAAGTNANRTAWPVAATMPFEIMECFARHGWLAAGAFWGRDGMHFQGTR